MRLILVQYAGDYLRASELLEERGIETYYGHGYVLTQLSRIQADLGSAAILCCRSPQRYSRTLKSGLTVMGAAADPRREPEKIHQMIADYKPTHVVVLGPLTNMLKWGVDNGCRVFGLFADSFEVSRLRRYVRYGSIKKVLNSPAVEWVANHGVNSCLSLKGIGVDSAKIVPWDWVYSRKPADVEPKTLPDEAKPISLLYVGLVNVRKGLGDAIAAVAELKRRGREVRLRVAGEGAVDEFRRQAQRLGVERDVEFIGLIPNQDVLAEMRAAAAVIVPSHHEYPEGLPLTIYEALCARTPIIASDHPMFRRHLTHRVSALVYRAKRSKELASCVEELMSDAKLYSRLSENAQTAWEGLQLPVKWGELLYRWARGAPDDTGWIRDHRLESGRYVF